MAKHVKCAECGIIDVSRPPVWGGPGVLVTPGHVGTSVKMLCPACGGVARLTAQGIEIGHPAKLCRNCCPTGHGTHPPGERPVYNGP